jgi:hypothetical protein
MGKRIRNYCEVFAVETHTFAKRKIPALDELQMEARLHHLFTATPRDIRIQVAEVAYRYDHDRELSNDLYLVTTGLLLERTARREAA